MKKWRRWLKRLLLPRSLMARVQVLVIFPILLIISINAFIFFERHWHEVQQVLVRSVVREIVYVIQNFDARQLHKTYTTAATFQMEVTFAPSQSIAEYRRQGNNKTDTLIANEIRKYLAYDFDIDTHQIGKRVYIWLQVPEGLIRFDLPRKRVESFTIRLMVAFVLLSGVLFIGLAALFMRRQVKPIVQLTHHIQENPLLFSPQKFPAYHKLLSPQGASEVRALIIAFNDFYQRQSAAMYERNEMLHGISHDLRTPLTRMKLQLAMLDSSPEVDALNHDIDIMSQMLESYLRFISDNAREEPKAYRLHDIVQTLQGRWQSHQPQLNFDLEALNSLVDDQKIYVRNHLFARVLDNLIDNGLRYGHQVWLSVGVTSAEKVHFYIDDDGPGIPSDQRERVLRAFFRLDGSRRSETGGAGLGLALAHEAIMIHGGKLTLSDSPQGGLRAMITLSLY